MKDTIGQLRTLGEAATPGPWWIEYEAGPESVWAAVAGTGGYTASAPIIDAYSEDAALIAALRNALPALLDRLDALEAVALAATMYAALGYGDYTSEFDRLIDALSTLAAMEAHK